MVEIADDEIKLLTLKIKFETLAEFSAAAKIFRARTNSEFLYRYVVQKISEARQSVTPEEFAALVEKEKRAIAGRSEKKSRERRQKLNAAEKDERRAVVEVEHFGAAGEKKPAALPKRRKTG
jgi:hypothetical protein